MIIWVLLQRAILHCCSALLLHHDAHRHNPRFLKVLLGTPLDRHRHHFIRRLHELGRCARRTCSAFLCSRRRTIPTSHTPTSSQHALLVSLYRFERARCRSCGCTDCRSSVSPVQPDPESHSRWLLAQQIPVSCIILYGFYSCSPFPLFLLLLGPAISPKKSEAKHEHGELPLP